MTYLSNERLFRAKTRAAALSIGSNSLLVLVKLVVGFWTGSVSVISEAIHSATDVVASGIAYLSVRVADEPPDDEHPYGHGKIESLSGLAEGVLILCAAALIVNEAFDKLLHRERAHDLPAVYGIWVMAISVLANVLLSRHLAKVADETDSPALHADAAHLRTDVITSVGVLVGLALARATGKAWIDPAAALFVAALILIAAIRLMKDALAPLLDTRLPEQDQAAIREKLELDDRVLGYHKLRTRKSGSQRHADVHVQIDDNCTLVQAHDLAEELEDKIRKSLPGVFINIHIEPYYAEMRHQQEAHGQLSSNVTLGPKCGPEVQTDEANRPRNSKETLPSLTPRRDGRRSSLSGRPPRTNG